MENITPIEYLQKHADAARAAAEDASKGPGFFANRVADRYADRFDTCQVLCRIIREEIPNPFITTATAN